MRILLGLCGLALPLGLAAQTAASSFVLIGAVRQPMTLDRAALERLPSSALTFPREGGDSTRFRGVPLWALLESAGMVVDSARKGDLLTRVVRVTGSDGYQVVFSAGELSPAFGDARVLVAFERDGAPLEPAKGFAQLVVPADHRRGRHLYQIVRIEVLMLPSAPAGQ